MGAGRKALGAGREMDKTPMFYLLPGFASMGHDVLDAQLFYQSWQCAPEVVASAG